MSANAPVLPPGPADVKARKGGAPLVCLTAYTTPMARLVDAHCDLVLVGDSVGMVLHGMPNTLGVTLDMMIMHGKAVARGISRSTLVVDLPFGSYEAGPQAAFASAARVLSETGASAVKLEGGAHMAPTIRFLVERSIPVMAHVGLTPQSVHVLGGYKVQGRDQDAQRILADAKAVAEAGAFSVVLEKIPASLAKRITGEIAIPTIGIGASADCDGQILVIDDMLGMFTSFRPKFVKRYADFGEIADSAISEYAREVRARTFPAPEHVFPDLAPAPKAKN